MQHHFPELKAIVIHWRNHTTTNGAHNFVNRWMTEEKLISSLTKGMAKLDHIVVYWKEASEKDRTTMHNLIKSQDYT